MTREEELAVARREIEESLRYCTFCARRVGLSFFGGAGGSWGRVGDALWGAWSALALLGLVAGEIVYLYGLLQTSASIDGFVVSLHIIGYGIISQAKLLTLYHKRSVFAGLIGELADLWPGGGDAEAAAVKRASLDTLRMFQFWYTFLTESGVSVYNVSPLVAYAWRRARGLDAAVGFVWHAAYPFDKHAPWCHAAVFAFEAFAGQASVWYMLSADLLFSAMTSHISMLLRLLQLRIRRVGVAEVAGGAGVAGFRGSEEDCLAEIAACVKMHQRLIKYFKDLEDSFSLVNLVNVTLSSVDICCVVFVIALLEPWMDMRNKFFLVAALIQTGALCWGADDITTVSAEVAEAVYESGWCEVNVRCRRSLLVIQQRAQKPLYFTAMKFNDITMNTYVSILTTAYSYFTLLYTMYSED